MNKNQFTASLMDHEFFKKDAENFINFIGENQLSMIGNLFLLDIYLSANNAIELHYHPNTTELIYVVSGEVEVGMLNADTNEWQSFQLERGEVMSIPQGWWHYVLAKKNYTHVLAIFEVQQVETIFGSDIFRKTPPNVLAHMYCLDEAEVEETFRPIKETVVIGPPADCEPKKQAEKIPSSRVSKGTSGSRDATVEVTQNQSNATLERDIAEGEISRNIVNQLSEKGIADRDGINEKLNNSDIARQEEGKQQVDIGEKGKNSSSYFGSEIKGAAYEVESTADEEQNKHQNQVGDIWGIAKIDRDIGVVESPAERGQVDSTSQLSSPEQMIASKQAEDLEVDENNVDRDMKHSMPEQQYPIVDTHDLNGHRNFANEKNYLPQVVQDPGLGWQKMLELEQQQMLQSIGSYPNTHPYELCQICLGYRY